MTKSEIEKAIENGESVWGIMDLGFVTNKICEINNQTYWGKLKEKEGLWFEINDYDTFMKFKNIFKTKAEAEHHAKWWDRTKIIRFVDENGNPPLPYEEFLEKKIFIINNKLMLFAINDDITLVDFSDKALKDLKAITRYDKTEQNYNLALEELYKRWKDRL